MCNLAHIFATEMSLIPVKRILCKISYNIAKVWRGSYKYLWLPLKTRAMLITRVTVKEATQRYKRQTDDEAQYSD